jgi:hypothetical protein
MWEEAVVAWSCKEGPRKTMKNFVRITGDLEYESQRYQLDSGVMNDLNSIFQAYFE